MMDAEEPPDQQHRDRLDEGEDALHAALAVLLVEGGEGPQHLGELAGLLADAKQVVAGGGEGAPLLERLGEGRAAADIAGRLLEGGPAPRDPDPAGGEGEGLHEPHPAREEGAHDGRPAGGVRLGEPAPEDRQGGEEVPGALAGPRLARERRGHQDGGGEHGGEQPAALVEPDPGAKDRLGEKGQLGGVFEEVRELRDDEDEDEEDGGEAGGDEDRGIGEGASDLGGGALVVLHLHDGLAEGLGEVAAQLARLDEVVDVVGEREAAPHRGTRGSSAPGGGERAIGVEGARELGMAAAAGLGKHRVGERHPGLEEGRELVERHHLILEAGAAAKDRGAAAGAALVDLDDGCGPRRSGPGRGPSRDTASACPFTTWPLRSMTSYSYSGTGDQSSRASRVILLPVVVCPCDALMRPSCSRVR